MKPKNFPARKNQRRIEAIERGMDEMSENYTAIKIVSYSEARSIRTKKRRDGKK